MDQVPYESVDINTVIVSFLAIQFPRDSFSQRIDRIINLFHPKIDDSQFISYG